MSDERIGVIVAEASTLDERMGGAFDVVAGDAAAEARLRRWRGRVADGDGRRAVRRLRAEGWDEAGVRARLGAVRLPPGAIPPAWAAVLAEAVELAAAPAGDDRAASPGAPLPFESVLLPFVRAGRRRVEASPHARLLERGARAELERALLRRLSATCAPALAVQLAARRALDGGAGEDGAGGEEGALAALVERFPAVARLAATHVEDWADATVEMLERLAADRRLLRAVFGGGRALGRVRRVEPALSDPHRRGRSVAVLELASGCAVVYKPRSLAVDAAWHALLAWLAARGAGPDLRAVAVADRGTHGWAEYAAAAPCAGPGEAALFAERAGALLALAYALGGADLHAENVVACGAHPVLVDVEMLLSTPPRRPGRRGAEPAPDSAHAASVLRTGLLPQWIPGPGGGDARREGGFAAAPASASLRNLPVEAGGEAPVEPDPAALDAGFARMYRALVRHRAGLLAPGGPLEAFAGAEVRVLLRATRVYDALLRRTRHPSFAASGVDRWIELDALSRPRLSPSPPPGSWAALRAERDDLSRGDVPIFVSFADGVAVRDSAGREVGVTRAGSGTAEAAARIRSLGERDLAVQRHLVRLSFAEPRAAPPSTRSEADRVGGEVEGDRIGLASDESAEMASDEDALTAGELAEEALAIARGLLRAGFRDADGHLTWIVPGRHGFAPAGDGFAHGRAGIAAFLAACAAASGDGEMRDAALSALAPLLLRGLSSRFGGMGIGVAEGMGGVVYGLARAGGFLRDDGVLRAAEDAARALRIGRRKADPAFDAIDAIDVSGGAAGAALGLLALHGATGSAAALERAVDCGRRLRSRLEGGGAGMRPGFAHGAAGIAHAFVRLRRATGDDDFLRDAEAALALGRRRPPARLAAGWCQGAAGIGLARAAALEVMGTRRRVDASVRAACRRPLLALDTACCGNLGVAELLLAAAERAGRPALRQRALALAARVVRRSRARRSYATVVEDRYAPGFLQGAAGIGYGLLRLSDPARFPSVLLWE